MTGNYDAFLWTTLPVTDSNGLTQKDMKVDPYRFPNSDYFREDFEQLQRWSSDAKYELDAFQRQDIKASVEQLNELAPKFFEGGWVCAYCKGKFYCVDCQFRRDSISKPRKTPYSLKGLAAMIVGDEKKKQDQKGQEPPLPPPWDIFAVESRIKCPKSRVKEFTPIDPLQYALYQFLMSEAAAHKPTAKTVSALDSILQYMSAKTPDGWVSMHDAPVFPEKNVANVCFLFRHAYSWLTLLTQEELRRYFMALMLILHDYMLEFPLEAWHTAAKECWTSTTVVTLFRLTCHLYEMSGMGGRPHLKWCLQLTALLTPRRAAVLWAETNFSITLLRSIQVSYPSYSLIQNLNAFVVDESFDWAAEQILSCDHLLTAQSPQFASTFPLLIFRTYGALGTETVPIADACNVICRAFNWLLLSGSDKCFELAVLLLLYIYERRIDQITGQSVRSSRINKRKRERDSGSGSARSPEFTSANKKRHKDESDKEKKVKEGKELKGLDEDTDLLADSPFMLTDPDEPVAASSSAGGSSSFSSFSGPAAALLPSSDTKATTLTLDTYQPKPSKKNLTKYPRMLYNTPKFSDCKVVCQGTSFYAHKCVLGPQSEMLDKLFEHKMADHNCVDFSANPLSVVRNFLLFSYGFGCKHICKFEDIVDLAKFAQAYQIVPLLEKCIALIRTHLEQVDDPLPAQEYKYIADFAAKHAPLEEQQTALFQSFVRHIRRRAVSVIRLFPALRAHTELFAAFIQFLFKTEGVFGGSKGPAMNHLRAVPIVSNSAAAILYGDTPTPAFNLKDKLRAVLQSRQ